MDDDDVPPLEATRSRTVESDGNHSSLALSVWLCGDWFFVERLKGWKGGDGWCCMCLFFCWLGGVF